MEIKIYIALARSLFKAFVKNNQFTLGEYWQFCLNSKCCSLNGQKIADWINASAFSSCPEELVLMEILVPEQDIVSLVSAHFNTIERDKDISYILLKINKILDVKQFLLLG